MSKNPIQRGGPVLPTETFAELLDGIALATDALDGQRLHRRDIDEARAHLRFAQRCATTIINRIGGNYAAQ